MSDQILRTMKRLQEIQRLLRLSEELSRPAAPSRPVPPRPPGLHKLTYGRLLRERQYLLQALASLPMRRTYPLQRKRLATQFRHRLARIERRLAGPLPTLLPKEWYRIGEAARLLHVSTRTLVRWSHTGWIECSHAQPGHTHHYFHRRELLRVMRALRS
jgi:DNA-binding transcriptional MerR regulator